MEKEEYPYHDRVTADVDVLVGKPIVRGTRIAVEHVLGQLADNLDIAELFEVFPDLTVDDVRACLAYAEALAAGAPVDPPPGPHPRWKAEARPSA